MAHLLDPPIGLTESNPVRDALLQETVRDKLLQAAHYHLTGSRNGPTFPRRSTSWRIEALGVAGSSPANARVSTTLNVVAELKLRWRKCDRETG